MKVTIETVDEKQIELNLNNDKFLLGLNDGEQYAVTAMNVEDINLLIIQLEMFRNFLEGIEN